MSIKIEDCVPPSMEIPRQKKIFICGNEAGDVKPSMHGDRLVWHSVIYVTDKRFLGSVLIQGHGSSPRAAIAASIADARDHRQAFIEKLAWLETELGVTEKTQEELRNASF